MPSNVITAPTVTPVTLAEAKLNLLVDHTADDTLITQMIETATLEAQTLAARSFITQTREMVLAAWPAAGVIRLEHPPVQSITSVTYITDAGTTVTVANTDYQLIADLTPPILTPVQGGNWPSATLRSYAPIRVRYVAGYGLAVAVPSDYKRLILGLVAVDYESREAISNNANQQRSRLQNALKMHWGYST